MPESNPELSGFYQKTKRLLETVDDKHMRIYLKLQEQLVDTKRTPAETTILLLKVGHGGKPGYAFFFSKQRVKDLTGVSDKHFARDCKLLYNSLWCKIIDGYFVINPAYVFNGSVDSQNRAITHWERGIFWSIDEFQTWQAVQREKTY